jgi:hypothetical protein
MFSPLNRGFSLPRRLAARATAELGRLAPVYMYVCMYVRLSMFSLPRRLAARATAELGRLAPVYMYICM